MPDALFELLANKDLGWDRLTEVGAKQIFEGKRSKLVDLAAEIAETIPLSKSVACSPFEFIASDSLSGGPYPCASPACRGTKLAELMEFAALYSTRVVIPESFSSLALRNASTVDTPYRVTFLTSLKFLYDLRPFLEAGVIQFAKHGQYEFCTDCYAKFMGTTATD
jgi:hypothetical protein